MTSAAAPDGTACSAHVTPPLPSTKRGIEPTTAFRHCRRVGRGAPARAARAYRMAPAARNRHPAMRNGGMVSTARRMVRYVEPQRT